MPEILVTGGTGKTGRRVADALRAAGHAPRIATRTPIGDGQVRFDWHDRGSARAFEATDAVYLVAPTDTTDHLDVMAPLLDRALQAGVRRFVLLSSSLLGLGDPMMGGVHAWLSRNAPEWAVLRPSWFMQNFSEQQHRATIRDEGVVYSAAGEGRVGFIDAEDIAAAAVSALTAPDAPNRDVVLTGPETLSYADVAAGLQKALGRPVRHVGLSREALADRFVHLGYPREYAETLAGLDDLIHSGAEDRTTDGVRQLAARPPRPFTRFLVDNADAWRR